MDTQPSPALSAPTLTPEELALRQRKLDDRDTRLLTALTITSGVVAAFCFVLAFQVSQYNGGHRGAAAGLPSEFDECTEGEVPSRCADGELCQNGDCVAAGAASRCERGALCDGNRSRAVKALGMSRGALLRRLKRYDEGQAPGSQPSAIAMVS